MDLRALRYFVAVYEGGSFSAASKVKFIAQPSISASVKQLEQSLGCSLFIRYARGVKPTEAGEQLYPLARQLLGQAVAIVEMFNTTPAKRPFRLGLIKGLGVERMSALLKQFTSAVDNLELTLVQPDEPCDARIISHDMLSSTEQFLPMWEERFLLAVPVNHALHLKPEVELRDLAGLAFIQRSPCEGSTLLSKILQENNIHLDVRARIRTIEYAIGLVKAGLGCAFIPVSSDSSKTQDVVFKPLHGLELSRRIGLATMQNSDTVNVLRKIVRVKL